MAIGRTNGQIGGIRAEYISGTDPTSPSYPGHDAVRIPLNVNISRYERIFAFVSIPSGGKVAEEYTISNGTITRIFTTYSSTSTSPVIVITNGEPYLAQTITESLVNTTYHVCFA